MGYIDPPEPPDSEVIFPAVGDQPAFTWGDHRQIAAMLDGLEQDNPALAESRAKLDTALEQAGYTINGKTVQICEFCWRREDQPHEIDCRDNNDPSLWVKREARGYEYLSDAFVVVHTTSVPMTDEEALDYFRVVQLMFPAHPDLKVRYIKKREVGGLTFAMMPWQYDSVTEEVTPIVRVDS